MLEIIKKEIEESIKTQKTIAQELPPKIEEAVKLIVKTYKSGGKVILFGNGGSAALAQHIAAELVGRFKLERDAFPVISLTTNTSILTALSNDYNFDLIFSRQIEALAEKRDIVIGISTSGNSVNVLKGIEKALKKGIKTIGLSGKDGGELNKIVDLSLVVSVQDIAHIQEGHLTIGHLICQLVEKELSGEGVG